eukprot:TRINITY_DN5992_c0_g1_i2.p1 TRINITY_DN5992_c0_g1~~TRINITY_DN5992_c0_g1_i2.p1  ORF type:complete len:802 (-),score=135.76 TRINITY_DN5992_c0_g1_i2:94-2499(-)
MEETKEEIKEEISLDKIKHQLIPPPRHITLHSTPNPILSSSWLVLYQDSLLWIDDVNNQWNSSLSYLSDSIANILLSICPKSKVVFECNDEKNRFNSNVLQLKLKFNESLNLLENDSIKWSSEINKQGYRLSIIESTLVTLEFSHHQGMINGLITFRQLVQLLNCTSPTSSPMITGSPLLRSSLNHSTDDISNSKKKEPKIKKSSSSLEELCVEFNCSSSFVSSSKRKTSLKKKRASQLSLDKILNSNENEQLELNGLPVGLSIQDYPDFHQRGFMLDISRNRIPTMDSLFELVDLLLELKLNQFQLYIEHTFAYKGHEKVWKDYSPMSSEEIKELDNYCKVRNIELIPNQNSFGHMNRWLVHEEYKHLAECPEGINHPFSFEKEPFSLCPNQKETFEFLNGLYDQILPSFSSENFNVGLDETFDLGVGRSHNQCKELGKEVVYLQYLNRIHEEISKRGKKMLFYADIIVRKPELISQLPKDITALIWGYEFDFDFDKHAKVFQQNQIDFFVCPGTSSWCSISGRTDNSLQNLRIASASGRKYEAKGYLITDWGDNGHLQQFSVSLFPISYGACCAWNLVDSLEPTSLHSSINRFVFKDESNNMTGIASELGNLYHYAVDFHVPNGSLLFWPLIFPLAIQKMPAVKALAKEKAGRFGEWMVYNLGSGMIKAASWFVGVNYKGLNIILESLVKLQDRLSDVKLQGKHSETISDQFLFTIEFLRFATKMTIFRSKVGLDKDVSQLADQPKKELLDCLEDLIPKFRSLWIRNCRQGGLDASTNYFHNLVAHIQGKSLVAPTRPK